VAVGGQSAGPIQHAGAEVGYVIADEIELTIDDRAYRLSPGDSFVFKSEHPHRYRNVGTTEASIFWVNTHPRSDAG